MRWGIIFISWFLPLWVFAAGLFGPEWTFTNNDLIQVEYTAGQETFDSYIKDWIETVRQKCPTCRVTENAVFIDDNVWFKVGVDPYVIEVNAAPMTLEQLKKYKIILQDLVFDTAKKIGLKVHRRLVGGHIHLDKASHFGKNHLLLRNFLVDLYNHSELFMGALSHDYLNAPPVAVMGRKAIDTLYECVADYDAGEYDISELISCINRYVYLSHDMMIAYEKYRAVNLLHPTTIEIRGFRPQTSMDHYIAMVTLLEKRIAMLKKLKEPLPLEVKDYTGQFDYTERKDMHTYKTHVPPQVILDAYRSYVEGAGLKWDDYKIYLADQRLERALRARERGSGKQSCESRLRGRSRAA